MYTYQTYKPHEQLTSDADSLPLTISTLANMRSSVNMAVTTGGEVKLESRSIVLNIAQEGGEGGSTTIRKLLREMAVFGLDEEV